MLERFTADARKVVVDARTKAAERGDASVGALHLLSALTTGDSVATRVLADLGVDTDAVDRELDRTPDAELLRSLGIDLDEIRRRAEDSFGEGALQRVPATSRSRLFRSPFTDEAKRSLVESLNEAREFHVSQLGAEHLLLGILRVADSKPRDPLHKTLGALGLDYATTRQHIQSRQRRASA